MLGLASTAMGLWEISTGLSGLGASVSAEFIGYGVGSIAAVPIAAGSFALIGKGVAEVSAGLTLWKNAETKNGVSESLADSQVKSKESRRKFPENPNNLLENLSRDRRGHIYVTENLRIRPEKHPLVSGDTFNLRHHGQHYHVEMRQDPTKSWSNPNNIIKLKPEGYQIGQGTGFLPGEIFPMVFE